MSPRVRSLRVLVVGGAALGFAADVVVRTPGFLVPRDFLEYWAAGRVNLRGGNPYHPDEPPLAMTVEQLRHLRDVARTLPDRPAVTDAGDAIIWVGRPLGAVLRQVGRGLAARISGGD